MPDNIDEKDKDRNIKNNEHINEKIDELTDDLIKTEDNLKENTENENEQIENSEESIKEELLEDNLKDKFDPTKYIPDNSNSKSSKGGGKIPFIVFGVIVALGIFAYILIGNLGDRNTIEDLAQEETQTEAAEINTLSTDVNDYKRRFWSGDTSLTLGDAFSNYKNAKNVEWLLYEKDGRTVLQIKAELDLKEILDYNGPEMKIGENNGNISEMAYLYFRKYQNEIKIYDNSYFYISKEEPGAENLNLSNREIEITNGKKTYKAHYSNDLSDIYNGRFNYTGTFTSMNNFFLEVVPKKNINISVKFDTKEKADEELNKVYQSLIGVLSDEQRVKLSTSQRAWLDYRDREFEFLSTVFFIKDDKNASEISNKFSEKYKIKIIETRISELNLYKELVDKNGFIKIDENDLNKQKDSLKQRFATLLTHLSGGELELMKDAQNKWNVFSDSEYQFAESLFQQYNITENPAYTLVYNLYTDRQKMIQNYDEIIF